jgi:hypothetical protein
MFDTWWNWCRIHASELFARKAEEALDADGELARAWRRDGGNDDDALPSPGPGRRGDATGIRYKRAAG